MYKDYTPLFSPEFNAAANNIADENQLGDRSPESTYVFNESIVLAVNVALATGRPLLVRGTSGSGKTSLAKSIAYHLQYAYRETVITARSQARDLLWTVDLLLRLQDAQQGCLSADWNDYIYPGPIWWAFDEASAQEQLLKNNQHRSKNESSQASQNTVLLIDEIDKADPDVPNNLLRPIGDLAFEVEETGKKICAKSAPLVIITTNEERDLPPAFLRRCVELNMPEFGKDDLIAIGKAHFSALAPELLSDAADIIINLGGNRRDRRGINAAEYLDILRACAELDLNSSSIMYRQLVEITLGISDKNTYEYQ